MYYLMYLMTTTDPYQAHMEHANNKYGVSE